MDELFKHPAAESLQTKNRYVYNRVTALWKQGWEKTEKPLCKSTQEVEPGGELGGGAERGGCWRREGAELHGGKLEPAEIKVQL